jgi:cytoskeletal protein RodZ
MKTVGDILKIRRIQKKLQVKDVTFAIKAKEQYLHAIENNDFSPFMDEVFALGFVRDYAEFLGINPEEITPFFRRTWETNKLKVKSDLPRGQAEKLKTSEDQNLQENMLIKKIEKAGRNISNIIIGIGTLIILIVFVGFLISEYQKNILKPQVTLINPVSDMSVTTLKFEIKGKTDIENKIYVNSEEVKVNSQGEFSQKVDLKTGLNKIKIKVVNPRGKETTVERLIFRK